MVRMWSVQLYSICKTERALCGGRTVHRIKLRWCHARCTIVDPLLQATVYRFFRWDEWVKCEVRGDSSSTQQAAQQHSSRGGKRERGRAKGRSLFFSFSFIKSVNIVTVCTTTLQYCTHYYVVSFKHRKTESDMGFNWTCRIESSSHKSCPLKHCGIVYWFQPIYRMGDSQNIINLEDGWNVEIKKKALDPLEVHM